jgi:hypothetical protein
MQLVIDPQGSVRCPTLRRSTCLVSVRCPSAGPATSSRTSRDAGTLICRQSAVPFSGRSIAAESPRAPLPNRRRANPRSVTSPAYPCCRVVTHGRADTTRDRSRRTRSVTGELTTVSKAVRTRIRFQIHPILDLHAVESSIPDPAIGRCNSSVTCSRPAVESGHGATTLASLVPDRRSTRPSHQSSLRRQPYVLRPMRSRRPVYALSGRARMLSS